MKIKYNSKIRMSFLQIVSIYIHALFSLALSKSAHCWKSIRVAKHLASVFLNKQVTLA